MLYDRIGVGYAGRRRPDPRIGARIEGALGAARSVLNVGAGAGSYEPASRRVVAVEPSVGMIRQRPQGAAPVVRGRAESLPFPDRSFDAAVAILTLHHWTDSHRGLAQMRRVARDRVVILTWDPEHPGFWLSQEYFPEIREMDRRRFPPLRTIAGALGRVDVLPVPVPADCRDGFLGAYWRRPAAYLDGAVRRAISAFGALEDPESGLQRLREDLADGSWDRRHAGLRDLDECDLGYRLIVSSS